MTKPTNDVDAFFATLDHPHIDALRALRRMILDADSAITEGIKWNVPSFQTTDYFATMHVRTKKGIGVILHFGAKKRVGLTARADIEDETSMLAWLADDRAVVAFADLKDVKAKKAAFTKIIKQWIEYL